MKFSIIVEARLGSSRLPNKVIYRIKKNVFLEYLIKRLKLSKKTDEIIIATTDLPSDNQIVEIAKKNKIKYHRGPENNVIKRVIDAGKKFKCQAIVRVTSDCPVIDVSIIDHIVETFKNNNCDYLSNANIRSYPDGMDVEVFSLKSLIKSMKLAKTKRALEWPTLSMRKNPKVFKLINIIAPQELYWPELGLTLDEYSDYKFLKKIILHFKEDYNFSCLDIIKLLQKNRSWLKINQNVKRNSLHSSFCT